jgi:hypothetical protein
LTISDGSVVTAISLDLAYDPRLLTIRAATVGAGVPSGSGVSLDTSTPGLAHLAFVSPTALPAGLVSFVSLAATVPGTAPYGSMELLGVRNVQVNQGGVAAVGDDGLHIAAYLGDASGNGEYSSQDAFLIQRVALGLDGGFTAYPLADPLLIADTSGDGAVNAQDAVLVTLEALGLTVPSVPDLPAGNQPPAGVPGSRFAVGTADTPGAATGRPPRGSNLYPSGLSSLNTGLNDGNDFLTGKERQETVRVGPVTPCGPLPVPPRARTCEEWS